MAVKGTLTVLRKTVVSHSINTVGFSTSFLLSPISFIFSYLLKEIVHVGIYVSLHACLFAPFLAIESLEISLTCFIDLDIFKNFMENSHRRYSSYYTCTYKNLKTLCLTFSWNC